MSTEHMRNLINKVDRKFDLTLTIPNWQEPVGDEEDPNWQEEIQVGVNYRTHGQHRPATFYEPAEEPEIEIQQVVDLRTGEDIGKQLSHKAVLALEDDIWDAITHGKY